MEKNHAHPEAARPRFPLARGIVKLNGGSFAFNIPTARPNGLLASVGVDGARTSVRPGGRNAHGMDDCPQASGGAAGMQNGALASAGENPDAGPDH